MGKDHMGKDSFQEIVILSIVPGLVGMLILLSWALDAWKIGPGFLNSGLALIAVLFGGYQRFVSGFKDIFNGRITVNVFVTVALIATVAIGEFRPAAVIVFIMAVVGAFETYTLDKSRKNIRNLLKLAPQTATVRRGETETAIPLNEVQIGDIFIVKPGERVPVDGIVIAGTSSVNQAPITGESIPVEKFKGSDLFSGTLNETGRLEVRATRVGEDTTLARIVHLVEEAQGTKAPIQNMADRFTVWFLPIVLVLAIIVFLASKNIKTAVSILLVACPCAFAIATPTAVTAGIANMARRAVLIKGGIFFELAGKLDALLVDKTGTFTMGRPKVLEILPLNGQRGNEILRLAAIAEKYSEHPLAQSIMAFAKERQIAVPDPDDFKSETGMGVIAKWNEQV
jgi:heavy metal translocating P-type ATPase